MLTSAIRDIASSTAKQAKPEASLVAKEPVKAGAATKAADKTSAAPTKVAASSRANSDHGTESKAVNNNGKLPVNANAHALDPGNSPAPAQHLLPSPYFAAAPPANAIQLDQLERGFVCPHPPSSSPFSSWTISHRPDDSTRNPLSDRVTPINSAAFASDPYMVSTHSQSAVVPASLFKNPNNANHTNAAGATSVVDDYGRFATPANAAAAARATDGATHTQERRVEHSRPPSRNNSGPGIPQSRRVASDRGTERFYSDRGSPARVQHGSNREIHRERAEWLDISDEYPLTPKDHFGNYRQPSGRDAALTLSQFKAELLAKVHDDLWVEGLYGRYLKSFGGGDGSAYAPPPTNFGSLSSHFF